jgi:hypothetical protein
MDKNQLPDELKELSDMIELFGFDQGLSDYYSANKHQQQSFRKALREAQRSMSDLKKALGVEDTRLFTDLYKNLLQTVLGSPSKVNSR